MTRRRCLRGRPRPKRGTLTRANVLSASRNSEICADASCAPIGMPWPSTTTTHFVPFPRRVFPTAEPLFSPAQMSRPGKPLPSPAAFVRSFAPAMPAKPATKCPAPPTSLTVASRSSRWDTRRVNHASERRFEVSIKCLPNNGDSTSTAFHAGPAAFSVQETTRQSASTARR